MNEAAHPNCSKEQDDLTPSRRLAYRLGLWICAFAVLYILRSFFLLIFLTFIFAYILSSGVDRLSSKIPNRTIRVVLVSAVFLGVIIAIVNFLIPRVRLQAETFAHRYPEYMRTLDRSLVKASDDYPVLERLFPQIDELRHTIDTPGDWRADQSVSGQIVRDMLTVDEGNHATTGAASQTVEALKAVFGKIIASISAFLLALLLSFLIVLDLPRLAESARELRRTKLRVAYDEIAPSIISFGRVLGRAFEAQIVIAFLNTLLTAIGVYLLGLGENVAFFSVIVFLCSFIPIAGVFISSIPICLLALQESGIFLTMLAIGMITVIHLIEAYILNPKIYGHHLRANPVIVLIILTIAGKLFHVWGLVLGVPVCTYIFSHAIRYDPRKHQSSAVIASPDQI